MTLCIQWHNIQVALETFSGLLVFDKKRADCKLVSVTVTLIIFLTRISDKGGSCPTQAEDIGGIQVHR